MKQNSYLSFHNTVLSSSNIHSSLIALKIQVSGATADLLHTLGGYVLTCRGTLNVKVQSHGILISSLLRRRETFLFIGKVVKVFYIIDWNVYCAGSTE